MRYSWIDYAKVIALFLVVMGHLVPDADICHKLIYNFHMPFFFFLSGLLHKEKSISSDIKRLLVPYLLLNVLMLLLETPWIYRKEHSFGFIGEMLSGIIYPVNTPISYPTWFLLSLFEIKLLVRLTRNMYGKIAMALGCVVFAVFVIPDDLKLPYFWANSINAAPYYIIGIATKSFFLTDIRNGHRKALINKPLIGGGILLAHLCLAAILPHIWTDVYHNPGQYLVCLAGVIGAAMIFMCLPNRRISSIEMISNGAIAIIGLHPLFIQYLRRGLLLLHFDSAINHIWQWLLYSTIVFLCSVITIPIIDKTMPILIGKKRK